MLQPLHTKMHPAEFNAYLRTTWAKAAATVLAVPASAIAITIEEKEEVVAELEGIRTTSTSLTFYVSVNGNPVDTETYTRIGHEVSRLLSPLKSN